MIEDITLQCNGLALSARISGPPEGVPLLCLHGWMDNAASYQALASHLLASHAPVRLCALDLPGHGHSQHRPSGTLYHYVDFVRDAHAAALALGWERYCVAGHSMGAGLATLLSAASEQVQRCVLIEGIGPVSTEAVQAPEVMRKALQQSVKVPGANAPLFASVEDAVRVRMTSRIKLDQPNARLICERALRQVEGGYRWRTDPRLRWTSMLRLTPELAMEFVRGMRAPTLLISAAEGMRDVLPEYQARVQAHPDLQHVVLPGGHHLHMQGSAGAAAEHISAFLTAGGYDEA